MEHDLLPLEALLVYADKEDIYAHITSSVMEEAAEKIEKQLFGL